MSDKNLDYKLQMPLGSEQDTKAVQELFNFQVIKLNGSVEQNGTILRNFFPSQLELLDKLKNNGFPPKKVHELSLKNKDFYLGLYDFGIDFKSFKKAGVSPFSLYGLKVIKNYQGYLHAKSWESPITVYSLIDDLGYTVKELLEDGIKKKDIPYEYLVAAG